ncbi:TetR/AcrR family transcriptional regulator [Amycolatopsis jiangsuensis]|uniref:AcrR family transcriptional regulator n=1 Tax=Amycolatopsis jiangsuensis TaxID=1181879 RepID=A0A840IP40_9PSEU|nr:TetR/AcrR family transcriptional regulator [Amycolatopsis jiangsuensis]MBB4684126.1 AcrR family transcriptional regulator [Amycolatopsis jiangsuensis]
MERNDAEPAKRGRGRPPSAEVRRRVLETAAAVLLENGISEVTFDKVARRAGVSRMTLYKWFRSPASLALAAFEDTYADSLRPESSGDLWADLRAHLREFAANLSEPRTAPMVAGLLGSAQHDPKLAEEISATYTRPRREGAVALLRAGRERGQLPAAVDAEALVDQLWGACYARLLLPEGKLDEAFADALVDNLRALADPG